MLLGRLYAGTRCGPPPPAHRVVMAAVHTRTIELDRAAEEAVFAIARAEGAREQRAVVRMRGGRRPE